MNFDSLRDCVLSIYNIFDDLDIAEKDAQIIEASKQRIYFKYIPPYYGSEFYLNKVRQSLKSYSYTEFVFCDCSYFEVIPQIKV